MKRAASILLLATLAWAETIAPSDINVVGSIDYGDTSAPVNYTGTPRYSALIFNGMANYKLEILVRGEHPAQTAIADSVLKPLVTGAGRIAFTVPDKGPDPEAYYILFRDPDGKNARFTVELRKNSAAHASHQRPPE